ncbi:beta-galactosidase family protein [Microbacterium sp. C7(2022)]|uniref:glycoside hydrolase family 35 protein n=1 Tax=Microbacterium sp. C7(2022) TaxID=2992759 RepID=UPI00237BCC12|nr:beta-galactosidase family protein [Microbacterium sp. C7(2022)]MDE0546258.1 beta-galactosidase [Microbacterium sp. C7(2022)]
MTEFTIGDTDFELDGRPHRILAGALHYFRVHPDQWADRIRKARLMGLNTIETYVAWNFHEPVRGEWDASGPRDLARFLDLVAAEGMHAIVRPGPYICAEWHNGGLPTWLTAMEGIGLRRSEPAYLAALTEYLDRVYEIVAPRQISRGGPVILVQIENEYGAYGNDKDYLRELVRVTRAAGITVPLTTIDQPTNEMLAAGSLEGLHLTGSFGSRATERLATLRAHQKTGPLMCAEFWDGWFDWIGSVHHTTSAEASAAELDAILSAGASVNFYMFHGGTNFGLTNGANHKGRYLPITTSYDYDAPLDEAGNPTAKYFAFRDVIAKYFDVPDEVPATAPDALTFDVPLRAVDARADAFSWTDAATAVSAVQPPTFEQLGHVSALVRYEAELPSMPGDGSSAVLAFGEVRDRGWVSVDGVRVGTLDRARHERAIVIPCGRRVSVLVEEQGRVNYDVRIGEHKGLIGPVAVDGVAVEGWTALPIDVEQWAAAVVSPAVAEAAGRVDPPARPGSGAPAEPPVIAGPVALAGSFTLDQPTDLFLDTTAWGHGFVAINGFLLGRYSQVGPQRTLYVPAPVVHAGENRIVVLELSHVTTPTAHFVPRADLGSREE